MICPAYKPESLMIDATLAPKVEFTNSFGTSVCNANHINAGHEPLPEAGAERAL
jgi:hypothetical protein